MTTPVPEWLRGLVQLLNCEISYGVRPTAAGPCEIQLSTFPWREGKTFSPASPSS